MSTPSVKGELSLSFKQGMVSLQFTSCPEDGPVPLQVVLALIAACGDVTLQMIEPDGVSCGGVTLQMIEPDGVSSGGMPRQMIEPDGVPSAAGS
jgi:hypothetical protein